LIFPGGTAGKFFEYFRKITLVYKAAFFADVLDGIVVCTQKLFGFLHSCTIKIVGKVFFSILVKESRQISVV